MRHEPITPELAEEMVTAIDEADTAFVVINLCDLTPQARQSLKTAWIKIQDVMAKLKGPKSVYAQVIKEIRSGTDDLERAALELLKEAQQ